MCSNSWGQVKRELSCVYYTGHLGGVTDAHPRSIQVTSEKNKVVKKVVNWRPVAGPWFKWPREKIKF